MKFWVNVHNLNMCSDENKNSTSNVIVCLHLEYGATYRDIFSKCNINRFDAAQSRGAKLC